MEENKICLRAVEPDDVDFIYECEADPLNAKWSDYKAPFSKNQILTYALTYDADPFSAGELRLIIEDQQKGKAGIIDLYNISQSDAKAYIGICIHPHFRREGYAGEALDMIEKMTRERLGLRKIIAKVSLANIPAINLFKDKNYKELAVLPEWHRIGNQFHDMLLLYKDLEL